MTANHPKVKDLAGVTPEIAAEYLSAKVTPNHSPRYANDVVTALRNAWDIVQGTGDGIVNPWDGKTKRDDDSAEKQPFTPDELKTIIEKAPSEEWRTLIMLAAYTGQRVGDCCNFKWTVIDFDNNVFKPFKQMKTGNIIRNLALHSDLRAQLEKTPKAERVGFIVPHFEERYRVNSSEISGGFSNYLQRIGLHKTEKRPGEKRVRSLTSFHSLRHTFISNAIAAGMTLDQVSLISGHLSRKNAERYSHANAEINAAVVMAQPALTGAGATATTNKMTQLERLVAGWSTDEIKAAIKALRKKIG
jgi:integrase